MDRKVNIFDKIGSLIPGYTGYSERDSRRNCDKQLRFRLSKKLEICENILIERMELAITKSDKEFMRKIEKCRKKLNTISSKLNYAPYGASGFFSDEKIENDTLEEVYTFDLRLLNITSDFEKCVTNQDDDEIMNKINMISSILIDRNDFILRQK